MNTNTHTRSVRRWFPLGSVTITAQAAKALDASKDRLTELLIRHQTGDWGLQRKLEMPRAVAESSNYSNELSVHRLSTGTKLWIMTTHDRRTTKVQLPFEE